MTVNHKSTLAEKRKIRVRRKISGTADRPRLTVLRSNKNLSAQVIDDDKKITLASASSVKSKLESSKAKKTESMTKTEEAKKVAEELYQQLAKKKITKLVFDRGSYRFHGRIKAALEVLREKGISV